MGIDQQYLRSQGSHPEDKKENAPGPDHADKQEDNTRRETYTVEHFKSLADQKNELKDEGMRERHTE